jgi:hypothetical protein
MMSPSGRLYKRSLEQHCKNIEIKSRKMSKQIFLEVKSSLTGQSTKERFVGIIVYPIFFAVQDDLCKVRTPVHKREKLFFSKS